MGMCQQVASDFEIYTILRDNCYMPKIICGQIIWTTCVCPM